MTVPNEGTGVTPPVTEGTTGAQDSGGILQPTDIAPKTQDKSSYEEEPANLLQFQSLADFQAALISDEDEEDTFEAGEDMDTEEQLTETTPQPSPSREPSPHPEGDAIQQS